MAGLAAAGLAAAAGFADVWTDGGGGTALYDPNKTNKKKKKQPFRNVI